MIKKMPNEFKQAIPVMEMIKTAGFEAYFVGGSVRDFLLGQPIHDVDIATSGFPEEIKEIFHHTIDVGIDHGTVLVLFEEEQYEITTFRTESDYQDYRRPDEVTFVRSLEEDLKRRDFTINALAMTIDGEIIDLFHGKEDLARGMIRAVGNASERFHEDALRMMRAVRFASQLGFKIESETFLGIEENSPLLAHISVERIHIEFVKMLFGLNRKQGIQAFLKSGLFKYCPNFYDKKSALTQLLSLNDEIRIEEEEIIWTLLVYFFNYDEAESLQFLKRWKLSNALIKATLKLYEGLTYRLQSDWTPLAIYPFSNTEVKLIEKILALLCEKNDVTRAIACYESLDIHHLKDIQISGQDILQEIDKPSGPWVGELLKEIERAIVLKELSNQKQSIFSYIHDKEL